MRTAPLPLPDGQGAIGFRDGKPDQPNFKEYTGACLMEPLQSGQTYMLDFFIGFRDAPGSLRLDMAVYATMDCTNLPFDQTDMNFGCPTNNPNYVLLGEMSFNGMNEWKNATFEFTPDQNFNVIVLGPACEENDSFEQDPYFFFDRLILAEQSEFGIPIVEVQGSACTEDLVLVSSDKMDGLYQWYKDGVAILGETDKTISIPNDINRDGTYMVVVENAIGCFAGDEYEVVTENSFLDIFAEICEGETYTVGEDVFTETGGYAFVLESNVEGCDTSVMLDLIVNEVNEEFLQTSICTGETVIVGGQEYISAGTYIQSFSNQFDCDSTITIQIDPEPGCNDCDARATNLIAQITIFKENEQTFKIALSNVDQITLNKSQLIELISIVAYEKEVAKKNGLLKSLSLGQLGEISLALIDIDTSKTTYTTLLSKRILKAIEEMKIGRSMAQTFTIK